MLLLLIVLGMACADAYTPRALGWISNIYTIGRNAEGSEFRLALNNSKLQAVHVKDGDEWKIYRSHENEQRNMIQNVRDGSCIDVWKHDWMPSPHVHAIPCNANKTNQDWNIKPSSLGNGWIQHEYHKEWCLSVHTIAPNQFSLPTMEKCAHGVQNQLFHFYA